MDLKGYVLFGGGMLLCAVLLHALGTVRRTNRSAPDANQAELDSEGSDSDLEDAIAMTPSHDAAEQGSHSATASAEASHGRGESSLGADSSGPATVSEAAQAADAAMMPADHEPAAGATQPRTADLKEARDQPGNGSRGGVGRKRLEPRVSGPLRAGLHRRAKPLPPRSTRRGGDESESLEDVIVIWMCAKPGCRLEGEGLLKELSARGVRFFSDGVFRKTDPEGSDLWYTIANGIEPGTFDMSDPAAMATPRIAMLLPLGSVGDPGTAFEDMLDVAGHLAESFGGSLKDERRSDMGVQTVEHCRQRIREYRRSHLRA